MSEIIKTPLSALVRSRKIAAISKLHFNTNGAPVKYLKLDFK